jgi:methyltransferase (TIGR00027 family)
MREGRPSLTAAAVSAARAVAGVDDVASALLPAPFGGVIAAIEKASTTAPWIARAVNAVSFGLVDHNELRTAAIDDALADALSSGIEQLVILGAGLDARAWRVERLANAVVFEVDYPSTQAYKRSRIATRRPFAKDVRYVAVDFETDSLADALDRAGHDGKAPTFWIWEGVTPYLDRAAIRATLAVVGERSPPGSRIAVTYATPRATPLGPFATKAALRVFARFGEPIRGLLEPAEMRADLESAGFAVTSDRAPREWPGAASHSRLLLVDERLAVAARR